ncbi:tachykinins isoform X2 [Drosophila gunungcola]|uniref:tachykinins isoform X2 n=1 Tax=Drosophila gunungcola TaxID=103775 RepID=UPI0022E6732D|nr:tachykinins isoform X2 [Drosophila gunungcola]
MRTQSGLIAVALLLLLLLPSPSTATDAEAEAENSASPLTGQPGAEQPRKVVKRAPTSSFIGMRGKKDEEGDTSEGNWLGPGPDPLDYADEEADSYYAENGRRLKKAPLAFVGMRGKKLFPINAARLSDVLQHLEEEHLRDSLLRDFWERMATGEGPAVGKRAPTGFTGMRGKRPALLGGDEDTEAEADEAMELSQKRAPVNSFVGMRGKKDVSHQHYKREALSKSYDLGKQQRFADFNSKFVAVRGKKADLEGNGIGNGEDHQQSLVHPWLYLWGEKRAPNGFLGMRGKRPAPFE